MFQYLSEGNFIGDRRALSRLEKTITSVIDNKIMITNISSGSSCRGLGSVVGNLFRVYETSTYIPNIRRFLRSNQRHKAQRE